MTCSPAVFAVGQGERAAWAAAVGRGRLLSARRPAAAGHVPLKDVLIQDAAYQSLLGSIASNSIRALHRRWRRVFPTSARPTRGTGASLYRGGPPAQAIGFWQQAGQRAIERSANLEAIGHLTTGLDVLKSCRTP